MKKGKSWLLEKHRECIQSPKTGEKMFDLGYELALDDMFIYIRQLDEPETLSLEWIDENKVARINDVRKMTTSVVLPVEKLKNLLVPKQGNGFVVFEKDKLDEEIQRMIDETYKEMNEKPVIPQFVADWIDAHDLHGNNPLREYRDLESDFNEGWTDEEDAAVYHWANKNPYTFIDALRYGYEVEKEKKYIVDIEGILFLAKFDDEPDVDAYGETILHNDDYIIELTEKEIKDYDERYIPFMIPVDEVNNE